MPRKARVRRAPNREPTSLAAFGSIEIIQPNLALTEGANISRYSTPQSHPSTSSRPPTKPPASTVYPLLDDELDIRYMYPILPPPQDRRFTRSSIPLPLPPLLLLLHPLAPPSIDNANISSDIQPTLTFKWTIEIEALLFHTLVEQINIGKQADSGFEKEA